MNMLHILWVCSNIILLWICLNVCCLDDILKYVSYLEAVLKYFCSGLVDILKCLLYFLFKCLFSEYFNMYVLF